MTKENILHEISKGDDDACFVRNGKGVEVDMGIEYRMKKRKGGVVSYSPGAQKLLLMDRDMSFRNP